MAQYTKHPVSAPPTAPERESTGHLMLRAYAALVLFTLFAPTALAHTIGPFFANGVGLLLSAATVAIGVPRLLKTRRETPFRWRRLPWTALVYVALVVLSIAWSQERAASALDALMLICVTTQAIFLAVWLTWRELLRTFGAALKWIVGLSLLLELWQSFSHTLFSSDRLFGIVRDADMLAALSLLAIVVVSIQAWMGSQRRSWNVAWLLVVVFLFIRAGSSATFVAAFGVVLVAAIVLIIRRAPSATARGNTYIVLAVMAVSAVILGWSLSAPLWDGVVGRASLVSRDLGILGILTLAVAFLAFLWRAWFFAVDRPRWDLDAHRPYSPVSMLPILVATILLIQQVTGTNPAALWGWMLLVLLSFKMKSVPLVGVGLSESERVIDRGERPRWIP